MGYNTTVVVLNDALHEIRDDKEFGKKLYDAVITVNRRERRDVSAGGHCNAATVIETHHADGIHLIAVGGNMGKDLGYVSSWRGEPEHFLRGLADQLGYRIVKKPAPKGPK